MPITVTVCTLVNIWRDGRIYRKGQTRAIYSEREYSTMCPPGYYQSANGYIVIHALGHMMYGYTLLVPVNQGVFNKSSKEYNKNWLEVTHDTQSATSA